MVFSSPLFLLKFLPIVFCINFVIEKKYSNVFLCLASLFFYAWGEPYMVWLLVFSIIINWLIGRGISKYREKCGFFLMSVGVAVNLSFLMYYKYFHFFADTLNMIAGKPVINIGNISLPIGISFFTFQAISYIIDVYRGESDATESIVSVALYISFFPQLIAGPIVKYRDINKQIHSERKIDADIISQGFRRFILGLGKKVLIANVLGECADKIYAMEIDYIDTKMAWIAAVTYTFQIYYDFSGYSDMAIGLGKMFGFAIPENFRYPYLSKSVSEFWRRWHISLGTWFREYVYIPLGGNRKGGLRTCLNLIAVFLLTGLWHGAGAAFVLWGIYQGIFVLIERVWGRRYLEKFPMMSMVYTFLIVNFGWILFRTADINAWCHLVLKMVLPCKKQIENSQIWLYMDRKTLYTLFIAIIGAGWVKSLIPEKSIQRFRGSTTDTICCTIILLLSIAALVGDTYNPFIYFQF